MTAVSLLVGGFIFVRLASLKQEPPRRAVAERSYNVETFVVESTAVREIITGFGSAVADRRVTVSAEVSGLVAEIHPNLEVGVRVLPPQAVGGGDVPSGIAPRDELLKIDPSTYLRRIDALDRQIAQLKVQRDQLAIEQKNSERLLETQQTNLKTAQAELDSKRRVQSAGAGNASQVRAAELQVNQYEAEVVRLKNTIGLIPSRVEAAEAQIAAAEAEMESARLDVKRTTISPPFAGVLSEVSVEQGQFVRPGDKLLEITDLGRIEVPIALTQTQFALLEPLLRDGNKPIARLAENESAEPRWSGRITRVSPVADEQTRTIDVFVEVDNSEQDTPLLPGTFVHVRIVGPVTRETIAIPREVIQQGTVYVVRKRDGGNSGEDADPTSNGSSDSSISTASTVSGDALYEARQVDIVVKRTVQAFAIIKSGLTAGDEVVMTNLDVVHEGALLTPQSKVTLVDELARQRTPALELAKKSTD